MKKALLTTLIFIIGLPLLAQEVRFPPTMVSAGGSSEGSSVTISRWRLAPVYIITLSDEKPKVKDLVSDADWVVSIYPNPVEDFLYFEFELPEERELLISITDAAGRIMFIQEARTYINGAIVELNMSRYVPALYLLQIASPNLKSREVYRIQKL